MVKVDEIGRWSEEKLDLLEKYLGTYSGILTAQKKPAPGKKGGWLREFYYIDAFAGSLTPKLKKKEMENDCHLLDGIDVSLFEDKYTEGSPLRALKTVPPFDAYYFIEKNSARYSHIIENLRGDYPDRKIRYYHGDCNNILLEEIIPLIPYNSFCRGLVFLDPYGLQVRWDVVQALAEAKTFDIFVNFPIMPITRQLLENGPTKKNEDEINLVMGNNDWKDEIYKKETKQLSLLPIEKTSRQSSIATILSEEYSKNLKILFQHVSDYKIMRNYQNCPLYSLILASHNKTGVQRMNSIFKKY